MQPQKKLRIRSLASDPIPKGVFVSPIRSRRLGDSVSLKIIGLMHGQHPITGLGIKTRKIAREELSKEKGLVLAEMKDKSFLPREYVKRAIQLEPTHDAVTNYLIRPIPARELITMALVAGGSSMASNAAELFVRVKKISGTAPRITLDKAFRENRSTARIANRIGVSPKQLQQGFQMLITTRSLLMASKALTEILINRSSSATIVVGGVHMAEIKMFIEKPKLAVRYIDLVRKRLEAAEMSSGNGMLGFHALLQELSYTRSIFLRQVRE